MILLATISVIFLANILPLSSEASKAEVRADTVLYVDPPSVKVLPATVFVVSVIVDDVVDMVGFVINLSFNSSVLEVLSVVNKHPWGGLTGGHEINNPAGYVHVYSALLGPPYVSGKSTLFTVAFNATTRGHSVLDLYSSTLAGALATPIAHTKIDGFATVYNIITVQDDYLTIQEAINEAYDGDIVFVRNGIYVENLIVNKSISLLGEDRETTVVDGGEVGTVIQVDSNNVTINGFEIRNCSMTWGDWGITLNHSSKSVISGNIVKAGYAIRVKGGSENNVKDNDVVGYDGSCVFHGLQLVNSSNNAVNNNNLSVNCHSALTMYNSSHNIISFNYISGHFAPFPFTIEESSNNSIVGNTMWQPAPLFGGHIQFTESNDNVLYHNSFLADEGPNTLSIDELSTNNIWDNYCEGNFWSDYNGTDSNGEGIGDTPYFIDENNQDNFPLIGPYWTSADINHDLEVDIYDVVTACAAYTSTPSSQNWNCHCDISEPYGVIDIFDIVMICSSYGEEYIP